MSDTVAECNLKSTPVKNKLYVPVFSQPIPRCIRGAIMLPCQCQLSLWSKNLIFQYSVVIKIGRNLSNLDKGVLVVSEGLSNVTLYLSVIFVLSKLFIIYFYTYLFLIFCLHRLGFLLSNRRE